VWEDSTGDMSSDDHHSAYLARAVAALTPAGKSRIDELLEQLVTAVGGREQVTRFATALKTDVDLGRTTGGSAPEEGLSRQDVDDLLPGRRGPVVARRPRGERAAGAPQGAELHGEPVGVAAVGEKDDGDDLPEV